MSNRTPENIAIVSIQQQEQAAQFRKRGIIESRVHQLKQSISNSGLKEPIIVERTNDGRFQLVDGNHRLEAYKSLNKTEIPAIIQEFSSEVEKRLFQAKLNDHDPSSANSDQDLIGLIETVTKDEQNRGRLLNNSKSRDLAKKRIASRVHESCSNNKSLQSVSTLVEKYFKNKIPSQGFKNWTAHSAIQACKDHLGVEAPKVTKSGQTFSDKQGNTHCIYTIEERSSNTDVFFAYAARKKMEDPTIKVHLVVHFNPEKIHFQGKSGTRSIEARRKNAADKIEQLNKVKLIHPESGIKMSAFDDLHFLPQIKDGPDCEDLEKLIPENI